MRLLHSLCLIALSFGSIVQATDVAAQRSLMAICHESCAAQNPDPDSNNFKACVATHCDTLEPPPAEEPSVRQISVPPSSAPGVWSVVGFEERSAVVASVQGGTSLSYDCDGRGGFFVGLAGTSGGGRIIGMVFDNGSAHYPNFSQQPTGFKIQLWDDHPLIVAIKRNNVVRLFEQDGTVIGDYSLHGATRAINTARANCG